MTQEEQIKQLKEAIDRLIKAWEILPEGRYSSYILSEWLNGPFYAAIKNLRSVRNSHDH